MEFKDYQVAVEKYFSVVGEDAQYTSKRVAWEIYKLVEPRFTEIDWALDVRITDMIVDDYAKQHPIKLFLSKPAKNELYPVLHQGLVGSAYYSSSSASSTPSIALGYYLLPRTSDGWDMLISTLYQDFYVKEQDGLARNDTEGTGARPAA